jgi:hypothetical protein
MLGLRGRRPGSHPGRGAGLRQVDGGIAAEIMPAPVGRHCFLVRAPTELRRLQALGAKALDRPGVDEHIARLRRTRALGVALGDMDALDPGALHQPRPVGAGLGLVESQADLGGDVEQRLLDEPRHHPRIGAAAAHRGDAAGPAAAQR